MNFESIVKNQKFEAIVIGGSAGSFSVITQILAELPQPFALPIFMCLHRLKDKREGFKEALEIKAKIKILEPDDKTPIENNIAYLAPANYHMLIENKNLIALATTELVQFSRPSIDVMFESAADVFKDKLLAILLSGANKDGADGMKVIKQRGGFTIIQDLSTCTMVTMPEAALKNTTIDLQLKPNDICEFLKVLNRFILNEVL
ncbi:MAG: putative chemotaxis protein-glutamate methylesterase [Bacteroidia bacterium]|nr:MAG: putative chemotaxis protein-glutamate methylesterase [Bacteroidia bacterium]